MDGPSARSVRCCRGDTPGAACLPALPCPISCAARPASGRLVGYVLGGGAGDEAHAFEAGCLGAAHDLRENFVARVEICTNTQLWLGILGGLAGQARFELIRTDGLVVPVEDALGIHGQIY